MKSNKSKKSNGQSKSRPSSGAIYKVQKKFEGGVREKAQAAIPAKGATFDAILKASKFPANKLGGYLSWMVRNGYLKKISAAA